MVVLAFITVNRVSFRRRTASTALAYEPNQASIKRNFVLTGWRRWHYLIPPDEMQELRDATIDGQEPRDDAHGRLYIRVPITATDGLPDSPPEWTDFLREGLLLGRVTDVRAVGLAEVCRATVNLAANEGILEGDVMTVQRHGPFYLVVVQIRPITMKTLTPG